MEQSESHKQIIELGKKITEDLGPTSRSDFLGGWMAHYVAELIERYESASVGEKEEAGRCAFEAILKLWSHRYQTSSGFDAIKRSKVILETLNRLNPDEKRPFYFRSRLEHDGQIEDECKVLSELALGVDRTTRKLLRALFYVMAMKSTDEETAKYAEFAMPESLTCDLEAVAELMAEIGSEDFPGIFEDLLGQVRNFGSLCMEFGSSNIIATDDDQASSV